MMTPEDWMERLAKEGYHNLTTVQMAANTDFGQHTHDKTTIHVILHGELTMTDAHGSITLHAGERFEIPAGTRHTAICGNEPFSMIIGIK